MKGGDEMKILVAVNSNKWNGSDVEAYLKKNGYEISSAKSSFILFEMLGKQDFDLVIVNQELHGLDEDDDYITKIRDLLPTKFNKRVIFIIHKDIEKVREKLINQHFFDFLVGRFKAEELLDLIQNPKCFDDVRVFQTKTDEIVPDNRNYKASTYYEVSNNIQIKHMTIGVGGVASASGTTHTVLGVGVFLSKNKNKVAIVDVSESQSLKNLFVYGREVKDRKCFKYMNIDFYYENKSSMNKDTSHFNDVFYEIKQNDYDYIIFDFGVLKKFNTTEGQMERMQNYHEMFRMNHQILCLNGSSWKWQDIVYFRSDEFAQVEPYINEWKLVINLAANGDYKKICYEIEKITCIEKIFKAPEYNPFLVNNELESHISTLLSDILPYQNNNNNRLKPFNFLKKLKVDSFSMPKKSNKN